MKIQCGNVEPDGRMLITDTEGKGILTIGTGAIDELAEAIIKHCGSEGDGTPFEIDLNTGTVEGI